jgi:membrane-associated protease RseP (regulator of RpoE activity)
MRLRRWTLLVPDWLPWTLVVLVCAQLATSATVSAIQSRAEAAEIAVRGAPPRGVPAAPAVVASRDGGELVARNMFCAACDGRSGVVQGPVAAPLASRLRVLSTWLADRPAASWAVVSDPVSGRQGGVYVGERLADGSMLIAVASGRIQIERDGQRGWLAVDGSAAPAPRAVAGAAEAGDVVAGVRQLGDGRIEVERALLERIRTDPMGLAGARAMPVQRGGAMTGLRLVRVTAGSPVAALGLQTGDVLEAANGIALTSPDRILRAVSELADADNITLAYQRRGKAAELVVHVR